MAKLALSAGKNCWVICNYQVAMRGFKTRSEPETQAKFHYNLNQRLKKGIKEQSELICDMILSKKFRFPSSIPALLRAPKDQSEEMKVYEKSITRIKLESERELSS